MRPATAISVAGVTEEFHVFHDRAGSIKEVASRLRFARGHSRLAALSDVSLEVGVGESVGLVGANGSGKSTLLRCVAGILPPTRGRVLVRGRVACMIELGTDFHPELTGRENAMLTAALHRLPRGRLVTRLPEIVAFAGLEDVIDQPARTYSSGMLGRLAFAVAAHVDPDVVLVDEVLAAADERFRRSCLERLAAMVEDGTTVVFVSHDLDLVEALCSRTVWLDRGRIAADGPTEAVLDEYRARALA